MKKIRLILILFCFPFALSAEEGQFSLNDLKQTALANNPQIMEKKAEWRKADADYKGAKASRLPLLKGDASFTWMTHPREPITLDAGELGQIPYGGTLVPIPQNDVVVYEGMKKTYYQLGLELTQPVFTWGKLQNAVKAAESGRNAAGLKLLWQENRTLTEISILFYSLYYVTEMEEILEEQKPITDRLAVISEESWKNGFILQTDYYDAKIKIREIDILGTELEGKRKNILLNLEELTGITDLTAERIDFSGIEPDISLFTLPGEDVLLVMADENSLELKLLREGISASEYLLKLEKGYRNGKPDLGLNIGMDITGESFPFSGEEWTDDWDVNVLFSVGISTTIYDFGRTRQKINAKASEKDEALCQYETGRNSIRRNVIQNRIALDLSRVKIDYLSLKAENEKLTADQKKRTWQSGYGDETLYLIALLDYHTARIKVCEEMINFHTARFTLQSLTDPYSPGEDY